MSVIVARALPDVRDGLKPVQRRTLYDMYELGIRWDKPYRKSARIVGDTMGKYHPHGDSSIYGALVVLAQDFKMGQPLVDGHGNFGSIEGDGAAAMRYTEARLQKLTQEAFLSDLDKGVVEFVPNFDETEKEPSVLPARIPNLLVNGSEGIAVGMATSIPPHNLGEVIDATIALIRDHSLTNEDLMKYIKGPDFPTGGIVVNEKELAHIYATGTGKIRIRGKVEVEKVPRSDKKRIVITQIPYTMIGAGIGKFLNDVAALADSRIGSDISDISNQSSKEGIRIVLELRKGADEEYIKKLLYKKTRLEDTFGVNMLAVSDGRPETLSLHDILEAHIDFQFEIATKKYRSMLDRELEKKEIQEGLIRAVDVIDLIIEILRGSKDRAMAKDCLVTGNTEGIRFKTKKSKTEASRLRFTQAQATAILEMRLYKLIGLEIDALTAEYEDTLKKIDTYTDILNNYSSTANVIILQLEEYRDSYARERRTRICDEDEVVLEVKKAEAYPCVLLVDRFGYARTVDEAVYEKNKEAADEENRIIIHCMSDSRLCVFTDTGKVHVLKVEKVPHGKFRDKGTPIDNLCNYDSASETFLAIRDLEVVKTQKLIFVTKNGYIKMVEGTEFDVSKLTVAGTKLEENDRLLCVHEAHFQAGCVLVTKNSMVLRIQEDEIPLQKKNARGVIGIRLADGDEVIQVFFLEDGAQTEAEINGRNVSLNRLKVAARGGKGSKIRK
jgi:DNA gyrase subunit A